MSERDEQESKNNQRQQTSGKHKESHDEGGHRLKQVKDVPELAVPNGKRHFLVQEKDPDDAHQHGVEDDRERKQANRPIFPNQRVVYGLPEVSPEPDIYVDVARVRQDDADRDEHEDEHQDQRAKAPTGNHEDDLVAGVL